MNNSPNIVQFPNLSQYKGHFADAAVVPKAWAGALKMVSPDTEPLAAALAQTANQKQPVAATPPVPVTPRSDGMLSRGAMAGG